jgi:hypothetical protein
VEGDEAPAEEEEDEDGEDYILIGVTVFSCYKELESDVFY